MIRAGGMSPNPPEGVIVSVSRQCKASNAVNDTESLLRSPSAVLILSMKLTCGIQ